LENENIFDDGLHFCVAFTQRNEIDEINQRDSLENRKCINFISQEENYEEDQRD